MIPNQWYAIIESKTLKKGKLLKLRRMGEDLVLWRDPTGEVVCMPDRCPHRGAALSLGHLKKGCIECHYHGMRFDPSGQCTRIPADGKDACIPEELKVKKFPAQDSYGFIWMWWGEDREELPELPWYDELPEGVPHNSATATEEWPVNYVRLIENSIDFSHFPSVHRSINPIARIGPHLNPYYVKMEEDGLIRTWGQFRKDNGRSAEESPGLPFRISVRFPNLVFFEGPDFKKLKLVTIHTPIDDENTWVVARYYQTFVTIPLLSKFAAWIFLVHDMRLLQSMDKPVQLSVRPKHSGVGVNVLVGADKGIEMYLEHRERLIREAEKSKEKNIAHHQLGSFSER